MPRVKKSLIAKAKHKKQLQSAKGYYGARSRLFKTAKQSNIKALQYSFRDRKVKKRSFRSLWISRINAALQNSDITYSRFIHKINKKNIIINRKILSELAVNEPQDFKKVIEIAKTS